MSSRIEDFLVHYLGLEIPKDISDLSPEARLRLLDRVIRLYTYRIPFQNVSLMSQPAGDRRLPTLDESAEDVLAGRGGMCFTDNAFFKPILDHLGFDAFYVAATVNYLHSHIIICVQNVTTEGDRYVVEVGSGFPSFHAIKMDFEKETTAFKDSFCQYKLVKVSDGDGEYPVYERWQKRDGVRPIPPADVRGEDADWYRFYHFTLEPRSFEFFTPYIGPIYDEGTGLGPFHKMITLAQYPDGKGVTLRTATAVDESGKSTRKFVLIRERDGEKPEKRAFLVDEESEYQSCLKLAGDLFPLLKSRLPVAFDNYRNLETL